jgi:predicted Rossmann fold flavoprotein
MERARQEGARFQGDTRITSIAREEDRWKLVTADGEGLEADAVIVATGGLSVPTTGSDGSGFAFARALDIPIHPLYPALTPLTSDDTRFTALSGIALDVTLTAIDGRRRAEAHGALLFTHRGYSGPVVLDVSHVIVRAADDGRRDVPLLAQWTPAGEEEWQERFRTAAAAGVTVLGLLRRELPERLAETLCAFAQVPPDRRLAQLRRDERARLLETLCRCPLPWNGHEGYRKAEVTGGGIPLSAVHPVTMESRTHPGLYFCGEVLDVFGPIGGFNFYWAWATGRAAGRGAASRGATSRGAASRGATSSGAALSTG